MLKNQPSTAIQLDPTQNIITIQLDSHQPFEKYRGTYSYESLPIEFKVLFENLQEFYCFLTHNTEERLKIKEGTLRVAANIIGKTKQFLLPLYQVQLSPQEQLMKEVYELKKELQEKLAQTVQLKQQLQSKEESLQEKEKVIDMLTEVIKSKENENKKCMGKIRLLEGQIQEFMEEEKNTARDQQLPRESPMTEEFTPARKSTVRSKKLKDLQEYGKKVYLKLDDSAKYYLKFKVSNNQIQKLHGPTYQLFHNEGLPKEGKYFFDLKIIHIKNNNIVVGVISDKNKEEQFSFKKMNCVCYNGYDGSICEQDKQKYVNIKPKEGQKIRTAVDMTNNKIDWYLISDLQKTQIGTATIPAAMIKQTLFPYFELYWEGNKIKLNS